MKKLKEREWEAWRYLNDDSIETAMYYLAKTFKSGDPELITSAIGDILKAKRLMSKLAKKANVSRAGLYRSLSGESDPGFGTVLRLLYEIGIVLRPCKRIDYKKVS